MSPSSRSLTSCLTQREFTDRVTLTAPPFCPRYSSAQFTAEGFVSIGGSHNALEETVTLTVEDTGIGARYFSEISRELDYSNHIEIDIND